VRIGDGDRGSVLAAITSPEAIVSIHEHLSLETQAPKMAADPHVRQRPTRLVRFGIATIGLAATGIAVRREAQKPERSRGERDGTAGVRLASTPVVWVSGDAR